MSAPSTPGGGPTPPPRPAPGAGPRPRAPGSVMQRMPKGAIQNVITIGSGKGGVGKSSLTTLVACEMVRKGLKVGLLDADITGPSVPKLLGLTGHLLDRGEGIEPATAANGLKAVSSQFLVEDAETPVVWRGPLVTRLIMQFFGAVNWGELDYLLVDMPPGTSDVPLTVFQAFPLDGMAFVSTPQELSGLIVKKAVNMARELHVALLGLVENMSVIDCPHCHTSIPLYGPSRGEAMAKEYDIPFLGGMPVDPKISELGDRGKLYEYTSPSISRATESLIQSLKEIRARRLTVL